MKRLRRQRHFSESALKKANRRKRQELLQHANKDQINAVSDDGSQFAEKEDPHRRSDLWETEKA